MTSKMEICCDNQGLLDRIQKHITKYNPSLCKFLFSETDIEMQIVDTLTQLDAHLYTLYHVKSHQNDDIIMGLETKRIL